MTDQPEVPPEVEDQRVRRYGATRPPMHDAVRRAVCPDCCAEVGQPCTGWREKGPIDIEPYPLEEPHPARVERAERMRQREEANKLFDPNPDHTEPAGMRRSIQRSHRGDGFNFID